MRDDRSVSLVVRIAAQADPQGGHAAALDQSEHMLVIVSHRMSEDERLLPYLVE